MGAYSPHTCVQVSGVTCAHVVAQPSPPPSLAPELALTLVAVPSRCLEGVLWEKQTPAPIAHPQCSPRGLGWRLGLGCWLCHLPPQMVAEAPAPRIPAPGSVLSGNWGSPRAHLQMVPVRVEEGVEVTAGAAPPYSASGQCVLSTWPRASPYLSAGALC